MQLLVSDANILIDLEDGQLSKFMFQLPYRYSIPDILFHDELENNHQHLLDMGLELSTLSSEIMKHATKLIEQYTKPSRYDCFALALAHSKGCTLLTGDKPLRNAAEKEGVVVKGTLWLVETMIRQSLLTVEEAEKAYQLMKESGSRLPWALAEARLNNLSEYCT
jgi:predicted nucleic acid-binding protein